MSVSAIVTPSAPALAGPYSPAVRAGDWVVLSGQLGLDPATGRLVDGLEAQARQVLANLQAVIGDCGAEIADVAKTMVFMTDLAGFPAVNAAYAEAFGSHRPARSTIQVAGLPMGALVEIEAWLYSPIR